MMENLTGNLLVASSLVSDPLLSRGVCLLVHDDDETVIGVMLNRPMQPNPKALLALLTQLDEESSAPLEDSNERQSDRFTNAPQAGAGSPHHSPFPADPSIGAVHFGGPLSGPVVAIHSQSEFAEAETGNGIYVAAQKQHLEGLVKKQLGTYRLIVGHLGWEVDQLNSELEAGLWHVVPATTENVFANAGDMWPHLIRRATSRSVARWLGVSDVPGASQLN